MHRTEGNDYVLEGGLRRFVDANPPTAPGTEDPAEYNNAVQEELCNIVELNGGSVNPTAAADRSVGWRQCFDMIFENQKIKEASLAANAVATNKIVALAVTDAKINSLTVAKLTDGTKVFGDATQLQIGSGVTGSSSFTKTAQAVFAAEGTTYQVSMQMNGKGMTMPAGGTSLGQGPGDTDIVTRTSEFDIAPTGVSTADRILDMAFAVAKVLTGIPKGTVIHGFSVQFTSGNEYCLPASVDYPLAGGDASVEVISISCLVPPSGATISAVSNARLIVHYDPTPVN